MTLPANIRINALLPFPSLVQGSGPITVAKASGIWTVAFNMANLATVVPTANALLTDYVIVYDSVANTFAKVSLSNIPSVLSQRAVTSSPISITTVDVGINININAGTPTCLLPLASTRNGLPLVFKDSGGHAATHNIVITATSPDTIDGAAFVTMNVNFEGLTLVPFNDGINTGWYIT